MGPKMPVDPKFKGFGLSYLYSQFQGEKVLFLTIIKLEISHIRRQHAFSLLLLGDLAAYEESLKEVFRIKRCVSRANKEPRSFRTSLKYLTS